MYQALYSEPESVGVAWCGVRCVQDAGSQEVVVKEGVWQPNFENRNQAYLSSLRFPPGR